ncbi:MAG TPA: hypothetical protein VHC63_15205 [Acidimicrobiales bacterium]|nr:hypothetical protein [Acidimicrobiales bacterium]
MAATATALSLAGAATLVSPAHAATPGVGTSAASSSLLNVALGSNGSLLNLKVLADDARSTIDPSVAAPEAFSRLNALSITSSVLPAPLNNISLPVVESRTPGGQPSVAGPGLNLSSIGSISLPVSILGGVLQPASLTSSLDGGVAKSGLTSTLGNLTLVGGLIKAAGLESTLGTTAATSDADGSRSIKAGTINVLDLGALLNGLGIPLTALPLGAVSSILSTLGVPVAGVPTSLTLNSFVDELNSTLDALQTQLTTATSTVTQTLDSTVGSILGGLNLPVPTVGDAVALVNQTIDQVQALVSQVLNTALKALDNVSLLKLGGVEVGANTKAGESVNDSVADIVAKIGSINVGGLTLPGLDLGSTLAQVNSVVNTVNSTLSSVLGAISPDLASLVHVSMFQKDAATGVTKDGGYVKSLAGVSALSASIVPPLNLTSIVNGLLGQAGTAGIGSVLTGLGGTLPVVDTAMTTLNGLLGTAVNALAGGASIKLASVTSGASFTTPVATTNGSLPRTGGNAQMALLGMALVIAAVASRRFVLAHRA